MSLSYQEYKNDYIVICEHMKKYEDFFIPLGGKWVRDSEISGFLIPKDKEAQLKKIINFINIKENAKSRKTQHKYHRAVSDSENEDNEDDEDDDSDDGEVKTKSPQNRKKYKKSDPKTYYKSFDSRPVNFKNINRDDDDDSDVYSSSSTYDDSSSDNYPSPGTPERKNIKVDELIKTINNLENRIEYLEKKNRK